MGCDLRLQRGSLYCHFCFPQLQFPEANRNLKMLHGKFYKMNKSYFLNFCVKQHDEI